jgi:hypothetical protein
MFKQTKLIINKHAILFSLKVDEICKSIAKYEGTVNDLRRQAEELCTIIPSQKDQVKTCPFLCQRKALNSYYATLMFM